MLRCAAEDAGSLLRRAASEGILYDCQRPRVRARQRADRPVGSDHQPSRAETFKRRLNVWPKLLCRPRSPVCFGDQTGQLAPDVGIGSQLLEVRSPGLIAAPLDVGFPEVVEHESLAGKRANEVDDFRQLSSVDQHVVRQAVALEPPSPRRNASDDRNPGSSDCTTWRTPRSLGWAEIRSSSASTAGDWRSTQPITPAMNG